MNKHQESGATVGTEGINLPETVSAPELRETRVILLIVASSMKTKKCQSGNGRMDKLYGVDK